MITKPLKYALAACLLLLVVYFGLISAISGWAYTQEQFSNFWYYLVPLAAGFGVQIGLYVHLRQLHRQMHTKGVVVVSGTSSTAAMLSCCTHYLINLLPILGATGLASLASQYQIEFFWLGLIINILGITFLWLKVQQSQTSNHF